MKKGEVISDTTMNLVLKYDLVIKDGQLAEDLQIEGNWRYSQEKMFEYATRKELYITQGLYLRRIVREPRYKGLKDLLLRLGDKKESGYSYSFDENNLQSGGWGSNEDAYEEQRLLFGEQGLMTCPKPVILLMKLISSVKDDSMYICDFFSVSGTTAEAVMRLNANGKQHHFIVIQLPENLDELYDNLTGDNKKQVGKLIHYLDEQNRSHTLDQLGLERLTRVAKNIRIGQTVNNFDLGFKHYTLKEPDNCSADSFVI